MFPLTRVRSILNALKSVHCDGAMASYNKIVVCCNNFVFFFSSFLNYFPKMLFRRRVVFAFLCNFVNTTAVD